MPEIITPPVVLILTAGLAHLVGSVPFGMIVTRSVGLENLHEIGSGNIGATNVLRTGNKLAAFLTLVFDAGTGAAAVLTTRVLLAEDAAQLARTCAFLGHLYPVWLGFRGGKGVATCLGVLLALSFPAELLVCMTWMAVAATLRISSLAALAAVASSPLWIFLVGHSQGILLTVVFIALVYLRHLPNIRRLAKGQEPRIGGKG